MPVLSKFPFTVLALVTLTACGCRTASTKTTPSATPYDAGQSAPLFRSYEPPSRSFDDGYQPGAPVPPTEIQPVPGFSEPAVPPTPSTQRQRRATFPAANRIPKLPPADEQVNQTAAKSTGRRAASLATRPASAPPLNSEPVPLPNTDTTSSNDAPVRHGTVNPWPGTRNNTPSRAAAPGVQPALLPPDA